MVNGVWETCLQLHGETEETYICNFYVVRTVHFGMKLYNDQHNAQAFNLFIYLLLPYMFRALIPYPGELNHCRNCTPDSENGPKGSPKHVRQK
jgi:hypothetical protein